MNIFRRILRSLGWRRTRSRGVLYPKGNALAFKCMRCGHEVPAEVRVRVYHRWYSTPCPKCGMRFMARSPRSEMAPGAPILQAGDSVIIWGARTL